MGMLEEDVASVQRRLPTEKTTALPGGSGQVSVRDPYPSHVTAEIPSVPVQRGYGVLLPDGTIWYPGSKRRLPAPLALRVLVWLLFLILLIGIAALVAERLHPDWFSLLRHVTPPPRVTAVSSSAYLPSLATHPDSRPTIEVLVNHSVRLGELALSAQIGSPARATTAALGQVAIG